MGRIKKEGLSLFFLLFLFGNINYFSYICITIKHKDMLSNLKASEIVQKVKEGYTLHKEDRFSTYYYLSKEGEDSIHLKKNSASSFIAKHSSNLEESRASYYTTTYCLKKYSKTLSLIHIRSTQSSFGTGDIHLFANQDMSCLIREITGKLYKEYIEINGEMVRVFHITIAPELNLRSRTDWDTEKKKEIADRIQTKYPFLSEGSPDFYNDYFTSYMLKKDISREKERLDNGYVLYKTYPKTHTPQEHVGGFGLETFFVETLISYVENGLCFGYIGHSCRKVWVDEILADVCLKHIKNEDFACWLTSTNGRHFGDYIESMVEENDREGVRAYIIEKLPSIHDKAVIYNHPDHRGNLASAIELFEKLKDMDMMMGETYTY